FPGSCSSCRYESRGKGRGRRRLSGPATRGRWSPCRWTTACRGVRSGETPPEGYKRSAALTGQVCPLKLRESASRFWSSAEDTILSDQYDKKRNGGDLGEDGKNHQTGERMVIEPTHERTPGKPKDAIG